MRNRFDQQLELLNEQLTPCLPQPPSPAATTPRTTAAAHTKAAVTPTPQARPTNRYGPRTYGW